MSPLTKLPLVPLVAAVSLGLLTGCDGDDDAPPPEHAGQSCTNADDCYRDVAAREDLAGTVECLAERVPDGYCTHTCAVDDDCCAVPGECRTGFAQVCSPLESATETYCFLSCEPADLEAAANAGYVAADDNAYCAYQAGPAFSCRSSGGGSDNRRVCMPNG